MNARAVRWFVLTPATLLVIVACGEQASGPAGPAQPQGPSLAVLVSDPLPAGSPSGLGSSAQFGNLASDSVVYVSMVPGTVSGGVSVTIRNLATRDTLTAPLVDGGFDPVTVPAGVGDTLEVTVRDGTGVVGRVLIVVVVRRPPIVVRVDPPRKKTDVPLNVVIIVVFSEPIDPATLDPATVRLLLGASPVGGAVALRPGSELVAEFTPASPLEPETTYQVVVTRGVRDRAGDSLEAQVEVQFTTGVAPPPINPPLVFAALSAGGEHTCGLTADSAAYCWGSGVYGQLGSALAGSVRPVPVASGLRFTAISAGGEFTCGIAGGTAYCWGQNLLGQLGNGSQAASATPAPVAGGLTFTAIAAGWRHVCGVTVDASAYCWGLNRAGAAGDSSAAQTCVDESGDTQRCTTVPRRLPGGLSFASLTAGAFLHTCGVTTNGQAYCWGYNGSGQLGNGSTTDAFAPLPVAGGLTFGSLDAGDTHTCGVSTSGAAYCWGSNLAGELGNGGGGFGDGRSPEPVLGSLTFTSVAAGFLYSCGTSGRGAYCWGNGAAGVLGNGSLDDTYVPVPVSGASFVAVSASRKFNYPVHTCGLARGGEAYCWGRNGSGQLGDGTSANSAVPVRVVGPP